MYFVYIPPDKSLFGHLTPQWLLTELNTLASYIGGDEPLKDLNVIVTHIKYSLKKNTDPKQIIEKELRGNNNLDINFIFTEQGDRTQL